MHFLRLLQLITVNYNNSSWTWFHDSRDCSSVVNQVTCCSILSITRRETNSKKKLKLKLKFLKRCCAVRLPSLLSPWYIFFVEKNSLPQLSKLHSKNILLRWPRFTLFYEKGVESLPEKWAKIKSIAMEVNYRLKLHQLLNKIKSRTVSKNDLLLMGAPCTKQEPLLDPKKRSLDHVNFIPKCLYIVRVYLMIFFILKVFVRQCKIFPT